jgi:hypothetical protein
MLLHVLQLPIQNLLYKLAQLRQGDWVRRPPLLWLLVAMLLLRLRLEALLHSVVRLIQLMLLCMCAPSGDPRWTVMRALHLPCAGFPSIAATIFSQSID